MDGGNFMSNIPDHEGDGEQHSARDDLLKWGLEEPALGRQRVDALVKEGNEEEDERRVDKHHLIGVEHEFPNLSVHPGRLEGPSGSLQNQSISIGPKIPIQCWPLTCWS